MEKENIAAMIGVLGTVIGTILGFFLTLSYDHFRSRRLLRKEFEGLRAALMLGVTTNEIPKNLKALRQFYLRNHYRLNSSSFDNFYVRWLHDPVVEQGISVLYDPDDAQSMRADLKNIEY